jgi:uncharacterized protein (TIGR03435 family)
MLDPIRMAYAVDPEKVSGGPDWLELDRFAVFAKAPEASIAETRRLMLQSLPAERFQLVIHNDNRPLPVYGLTTKHPPLKEASGDGESGGKYSGREPIDRSPCRMPAGIRACRGSPSRFCMPRVQAST